MGDPLEDGVPRAIALTWGMVADPQRGPKRGLSHEGIVEAAVKIADAEGLGSVTMSKVASSLGVTTMALYRYVTNKDELLLLMQEGVLTTSTPDPTLSDGKTDVEAAGWREELREFAGMIRGVYRDHPWLTEMPQSVSQLLTPTNVSAVNHALRAMRELPIPDLDKIAILLAITSYVRANAAMQRDLGQHAGEDALDPAEFLREVITAEDYPYLFPLTQAGSYLSEDPEEDELADFRFGLDLIMNGIAVYADAISADTESAEESSAPKALPLELDHVRRDPKVRETMSKRKEAEGKLREARRKEQEAIKRAIERGPK